jgi:hypothetical protein
MISPPRVVYISAVSINVIFVDFNLKFQLLWLCN